METLWSIWNGFWSLEQPAVARLQFIATSVLSLGSVAIAWVAWRTAHRNSFGWDPKIFVVGRRHLGGAVDGSADAIAVIITIWNRRKYSISVSVVGARIPHLDVRRIGGERAYGMLDLDYGGNDWRIERGELVTDSREVIKAGEYANFEVVVELGTRYVTEGRIFFNVDVKAFVFDPVRGKHFLLRNSGHTQNSLVASFEKQWGWQEPAPVDGPPGP